MHKWRWRVGGQSWSWQEKTGSYRYKLKSETKLAKRFIIHNNEIPYFLLQGRSTCMSSTTEYGCMMFCFFYVFSPLQSWVSSLWSGGITEEEDLKEQVNITMLYDTIHVQLVLWKRLHWYNINRWMKTELKETWNAVFECFYIGLRGPLILYLKYLSRNSAMVHNYSHYEQSLNELYSKRAVSVSVALHANEEASGSPLR